MIYKAKRKPEGQSEYGACRLVAVIGSEYYESNRRRPHGEMPKTVNLVRDITVIERAIIAEVILRV